MGDASRGSEDDNLNYEDADAENNVEDGEEDEDEEDSEEEEDREDKLETELDASIKMEQDLDIVENGKPWQSFEKVNIDSFNSS